MHSIAYAPREAIDGDFLEGISREAFRIAHDVSSYSFAALAKAALPMMQGSTRALLTLTYLGAVRTMPNYNVMGLAKASLEAAVRYMAASLGPKGIRVNAVSAGPIKTLAASGIASFGKLLAYNAKQAPLRRNVTIDEVGNAAAFLCSDLASGITGEVTYVDGGFNTTALGTTEAVIGGLERLAERALPRASLTAFLLQVFPDDFYLGRGPQAGDIGSESSCAACCASCSCSAFCCAASAGGASITREIR